jgi:hypothetical protein
LNLLDQKSFLIIKLLVIRSIIVKGGEKRDQFFLVLLENVEDGLGFVGIRYKDLLESLG